MIRQVQDRVRRRPVVAYYILAFAISWGAIVLAVGPGGMFGTGATIVVSGIVSLAGPSLAGLLLTGVVDGRDGYRRLASRGLRWRVAPRFYALALLTGPGVMVATILALSAADPDFLPTILTSEDKVGPIVTGVGAAVFVSVLEELGWTGFAMPRLLARRGVLVTGLVMGVLWSAWHFPFFAGSTDATGVVPAPLLVAVLLFAWLPPYRLLMVWLYERTGSLLLVMLMHAPIVMCQFVLASDVSAAGQIALLVGWAVLFWTMALVAVARSGRSVVRARAVAAPGLARRTG